jgi:hypothetical protein
LHPTFKQFIHEKFKANRSTSATLEEPQREKLHRLLLEQCLKDREGN